MYWDLLLLLLHVYNNENNCLNEITVNVKTCSINRIPDPGEKILILKNMIVLIFLIHYLKLSHLTLDE